jgi:hypothetical protein
MPGVSSEKNLDEVVQWAVRSGFEVISVLDSHHDFVVEVAEKETMLHLQIVHENHDSPFVMMVGLVKIPETDRERLKELGPGRFADLIWDIKLNLVRMGVDFTVLGAEGDPDAWETQKKLFLGGTDINQFYDAYSKVKNSIIGIIWAYKRELDSMGWSIGMT